MAAVTGAAIAVAGLGMSAAQAIKSSKDMKTAANAAQAAKNDLAKISETNAFKQVQVPTLGLNLAQQSQAQRSASALSAVQSAGAEGVIGGVGQIMQAGNEQDLQLAAQADEAKFKRDAMQADAEMGISARKQERDFLIGSQEVQSENMKRAQAEENRNAAITGMFESAGSAITAGSQAVNLYKNNPLNQSDLKTKQWNPTQFNKFGKVNGQDLDFESFGNMTSNDFDAFLSKLSPQQMKQLRKQ